MLKSSFVSCFNNKIIIYQICIRKHFYCIDTLGFFLTKINMISLFKRKLRWQAQSISFVSGKTGIAMSVRYLEFLGTTSKANSSTL